jgi:hypothetical protein
VCVCVCVCVCVRERERERERNKPVFLHIQYCGWQVLADGTVHVLTEDRILP